MDPVNSYETKGNNKREQKGTKHWRTEQRRTEENNSQVTNGTQTEHKRQVKDRQHSKVKLRRAEGPHKGPKTLGERRLSREILIRIKSRPLLRTLGYKYQ